MQRRKPASAKQRKAQLQLKRAVKRGDVTLPDSQKSRNRPNSTGRRVGPSGRLVGPGPSASQGPHVASARRLQSSFVKVPAAYLEQSKNVASTVPLSRPITINRVVLDNLLVVRSNGVSKDPDGAHSISLTCPKRPKWRYDMAKKEVERNEEGMFEKWLAQTDSSIARCLRVEEAMQDGDDPTPHGGPVLQSLTYFERNLEVWRQL